MNTWFTSDTHHSHKNIAGEKVSSWQSGYRKFDSIDEMNQILIENINKCAGEDDILYHLGDWSFGGAQSILLFRKEISCKTIHLIRGNHDKHIFNKWIDFGDRKFNPMHLFTSVNKDFAGEIDGKRFYLCHYFTPGWETIYKDSIHLFGHHHGTRPGVGKSMDVGVDAHPEFRPFHIDEICEKFKKQ